MGTPLANERWGTAATPADGMKKPDVSREGGEAGEEDGVEKPPGEEDVVEKPPDVGEQKKSRDMNKLSNSSKGLSKLRRRPDS